HEVSSLSSRVASSQAASRRLMLCIPGTTLRVKYTRWESNSRVYGRPHPRLLPTAGGCTGASGLRGSHLANAEIRVVFDDGRRASDALRARQREAAEQPRGGPGEARDGARPGAGERHQRHDEGDDERAEQVAVVVLPARPRKEVGHGPGAQEAERRAVAAE